MVLGFLNRAAIKVSIDRLAGHAATQEAFDGGKPTAFPDRNVVEGFFEKYGSTSRKFDYHASHQFYIGYVNIPKCSEILCVVFMQEKGSTIASFEPDISNRQDVIGLMEKKMFADQVVEGILAAQKQGG